MNLVLVNVPFATPAAPPYALGNLSGFLKRNLSSSHAVSIVDLNLEFHRLRFPRFDEFIHDPDMDEYAVMTKQFMDESRACYAANNRVIRTGAVPEFFDELLSRVLEKNPSKVLMSIVYSSQVFYAHALISAL